MRNEASSVHCPAHVYDNRMQAPQIIAHRTCPLDAPENSLAGISMAAESGADAVEIDLRLSLDGEPFLMHDWLMRRTTGFPLPVELTPAFLIRRQRQREGGAPVPSLSDALDALPLGFGLAVDVKTPWAAGALVDEVERRGLSNRVLIWCTSARTVRYVARRAPAIECAYLKNVTDAAAKRRFLDRAVALGAGAISAHWRAIDSDFVAAAHAARLRVYSWHSRSDLTPAKLGAGLDGLITDRPAVARQAYADLA